MAVANNVATQSLTLPSGIAVQAPAGFCIDPTKTQETAAGAVVLMASCANLGARAANGPYDIGLLTLTYVVGSHGGPQALAARLDQTPARLGRGGAGVEVHRRRTTQVALYANLTDRAADGPTGTDPRHWKAAFDLGNRAAIASVYGPPGSALTKAAGEALIRDLVQAQLDANSGAANFARIEGPATETVATPAAVSENTPNSNEGWLANRVGGLLRAVRPGAQS